MQSELGLLRGKIKLLDHYAQFDEQISVFPQLPQYSYDVKSDDTKQFDKQLLKPDFEQPPFIGGTTTSFHASQVQNNSDGAACSYMRSQSPTFFK
ncbi:MAG: hypothetical protein EZS28_007850 [Streblomastix strix]|uniref:Uncharacterized protein n=1 Tax=Streblomastix strix TaxID=222440 RepID=A0A5J4WPS9_9EUKA|nr:MAG: hypothetical protein EZS28_007850 [Streblomastix strix]